MDINNILTDADLQEFVEIWKREFDEDINLDRARHEARLLLELYAMFARPLPEDAHDREDVGR